MMKHLSSYFLPASLTWWAGILAVALGILSMTGWHEEQVSQIGVVLATLYGGHASSPASLILLGLGLLGFRAKQERS